MGDTNNRNNDVELIREAIGNPDGCEIRLERIWCIVAPREEDNELSIERIEYNIFQNFNLVFVKCNFKCALELHGHFSKIIRFLNCTFDKELSMYGIFEDIIYFTESTFKDKVTIQYTHFKEKVFFTRSTFYKDNNIIDNIFEHRVDFNFVIFKEKIDFNSNINKQEISFCAATFEANLKFLSNKFLDNVYFDGAKFQYADFRLSVFDKYVHFYKTTFYVEPNFLQVIFDGSINLTGIKIFDFNFDEFKSIIKDKATENKTTEDQTAAEFRNIFKNIKNGLIKDNNLLDASHFHKMELYAKELELECTRKEKVENPTCWNTFMRLLGQGEKEKVRTLEFRDIIDEIQLYCYRLTSDHHTNLLLILNHIIFLIALFGVVSLVLTLCITDSNLENIIAKMNKAETKATLAASLIFLGITLYVIFTCCKPSISKLIYLASILLLSAIFIFSPAFMLIIVSICSIVLLFLIFFACIVTFQCTTKDCFEIKNYIFICSYPIVAFMLFSNPSSILPILGKLIENKSGEICLFVVGNVKLLCCGGNSYSQTLNLIYMLFLFLLLWSLQKTARKNTIVPD